MPRRPLFDVDDDQVVPASQQAPAELHTAKQALDQAERAFADDADSPETKDYAYIATRKAEYADASARLRAPIFA